MMQLIQSIRVDYGAEEADLVAGVVGVVRSKIVARNLFGWRDFIDDVVVDLVAHMIRTEFQYSGGAYVNCGMQGAIDACRYCSAAKRRGNYETVSLSEVENFMTPQEEPSNREKTNELVVDIERMYGPEIAQNIADYLEGRVERLSKEVLAKCRTKQFRAWLEEYRQ